jgi:hypothetical protein
LFLVYRSNTCNDRYVTYSHQQRVEQRMGDFVVFLPQHSGEYLDELSDLILLPKTRVMLSSIEIGSTSFDGKRDDLKTHDLGTVNERQVGREGAHSRESEGNHLSEHNSSGTDAG